MLSRKALKRSALAALGVVLIAGIVLYVQASLVPSAYRPAELEPEHTISVSSSFSTRHSNLKM